jgi:hypothetical protein
MGSLRRLARIFAGHTTADESQFRRGLLAPQGALVPCAAWRVTCRLFSDMSARYRARSFATLTLPGSATRGMSAVALFAAVQVADGILTLAGVARFGPAVESNPILSASMMALGAAPALSIAKIMAVLLATVLHGARCHLMLALLTILYVFVALLPWTVLLLT